LVNNTGETGYDVTFQITGSAQPPLTLSTGGVATVLSDGQNLYSLTQSSSGLFYAADGSAAAPSFSFNNDTTTGLYLAGNGILGITANGNELIDVDGSNLLQPLVTVNATLNAELISGGTF